MLRGTYTTAVLNIITWNKAYSIFPDATFLGRETFMLYPLNDNYRLRLSKYAERGWQNWVTSKEPQTTSTERQPFWTSLTVPSRSSLGGHRRIADERTWIVEFDTEGVQPPSIPGSVLEHSCFAIAEKEYKYEEPGNSSGQSQPGSSFKILCASFRSILFQYQYTQSTHQYPWEHF
jgi:hypothetical protein